jgi:hypothetical protein
MDRETDDEQGIGLGHRLCLWVEKCKALIVSDQVIHKILIFSFAGRAARQIIGVFDFCQPFQ